MFGDERLGWRFLIEVDKDFGLCIANLTDFKTQEALGIDPMLLQILKDILLCKR